MTTVSQIVRQCETLLAQCVIAANEASQAAALVQGAAPLNSPAFTGLPTAPTAPQNSNNFLLATTAYLDRLFGTANGLPTLDATGHIPTAQLPSSVLGGLSYLRIWNAATNTPHLTSGSGTGGNFYIVGVSGSTTIDGNSTWNTGDWIVYAGGGTNAWQRVQPTYNPIVIPLSDLALQAAYTIVMNATGSAAAPTAQPIASIASLLPDMVGASGTFGGTRGFVPAPGASGTAGTRFLSEAGDFEVPPKPSMTGYALLNGPAFIGNPTAPTIARGVSSTAIATAELVIKNLATATEIMPVVDGTASQGTSTYGARVDHIHPTDTSRAPSTGIALSALAQQAPNTFVANGTSGTASPTAITAVAAAALLPAMVGASGTAAGTQGLVPAPAGGDGTAGKFLKADGTYAVPPGTAAALSSKVGSFTRDLATASGSVGYTGVGFTPTSIEFFWSDSVSGNSGQGAVDSTKSGRAAIVAPDSTGTGNPGAGNGGFALYVSQSPSSASALHNQTAVVASFNSDGFTLTWTKNNIPTGTITVNYIAYK